MLGLPQCQRCGTEVDYDNHNRNGYNGKNGYNSAIMASMTKIGFSAKGSRVWQSYCQCFNTLISRLLNKHCVGSLDRISKFLGSSSTPFPMARHKAEHWFCIASLAPAGLRVSGGRFWVYEQHHSVHKKLYT